MIEREKTARDNRKTARDNRKNGKRQSENSMKQLEKTEGNELQKEKEKPLLKRQRPMARGGSDRAFDDEIKVCLKRLLDKHVWNFRIQEALCITMEVPHTLVGVFNSAVFLRKFH